MLPVAAVLVDFDGTITTVDVTEQLLTAYGDPSWPEYDDAVDRGEIGLRQALTAQNAMLDGDRDALTAHALRVARVDPTFAPFVRWLQTNDVPVVVVSDGFAFYIRPILAGVGLGHLEVITNDQRWRDQRPDGLAFVSGHPVCVGCGTCKMQAVQRFRERGPVAFIGEGQTDRYAALYADITFAKLDLVDHCVADGVPFVAWGDFDDVRSSLVTLDTLPGPVAPVQCPGWTLPDPSPTV